MLSYFIQENDDFYLDEQLDLGDPIFRGTHPAAALDPSDSHRLPWRCNLPQISPIKSATDQICGELLMSKALHPAGSGGYPPIQASPRNPQLDTPDRPDACLKMSIQDETIVKL